MHGSGVLHPVARARYPRGPRWGITCAVTAPGGAHPGHHLTLGRPQVGTSPPQVGDLCGLPDLQIWQLNRLLLTNPGIPWHVRTTNPPRPPVRSPRMSASSVSGTPGPFHDSDQPYFCTQVTSASSGCAWYVRQYASKARTWGAHPGHHRRRAGRRWGAPRASPHPRAAPGGAITVMPHRGPRGYRARATGFSTTQAAQLVKDKSRRSHASPTRSASSAASAARD